MPRKSITLILVLCISVLSCSRFSVPDPIKLPLTNRPNSLDSAQAECVFNSARRFPNGTQISICIIEGESEKYIGIERINDSLVYVNNSDSIFEIGSITKTFTGTMLAKMIYDKKVKQDSPIKQFLPFQMNQSSLNGQEITLVHLANHTSGLPFEPTNIQKSGEYFDRYNPYQYYDTTKLYNYLAHHVVLSSTPGEKRTYSNLGGGLLGHLLTLISGKTYEELLFEYICAPLKMKNTFVNFNDERKRRTVKGRNENGEPLPSNSNCGALTGAGGIKSSVKDLVKYLRANMNDTTYFSLAQKTTKQYDEHFTGSLGWAPYSDLGKRHMGAFGATGGYTSGLIFERNDCVGIVVLTNVSPFLESHGNNTEKLCRALYDPLPFAVKEKK